MQLKNKKSRHRKHSKAHRELLAAESCWNQSGVETYSPYNFSRIFRSFLPSRRRNCQRFLGGNGLVGVAGSAFLMLRFLYVFVSFFLCCQSFRIYAFVLWLQSARCFPFNSPRNFPLSISDLTIFGHFSAVTPVPGKTSPFADPCRVPHSISLEFHLIFFLRRVCRLEI